MSPLVSGLTVLRPPLTPGPARRRQYRGPDHDAVAHDPLLQPDPGMGLQEAEDREDGEGDEDPDREEADQLSRSGPADDGEHGDEDPGGTVQDPRSDECRPLSKGSGKELGREARHAVCRDRPAVMRSAVFEPACLQAARPNPTTSRLWATRSATTTGRVGAPMAVSSLLDCEMKSWSFHTTAARHRRQGPGEGSDSAEQREPGHRSPPAPGANRVLQEDHLDLLSVTHGFTQQLPPPQRWACCFAVMSRPSSTEDPWPPKTVGMVRDFGLWGDVLDGSRLRKGPRRPQRALPGGVECPVSFRRDRRWLPAISRSCGSTRCSRSSS